MNTEHETEMELDTEMETETDAGLGNAPAESVAEETTTVTAGTAQAGTTAAAPAWRPIPARQRRLLAVLMEKAKTTPDSYPLSLASLIAGANQKSNRHPLMNLTPEQVEDDLTALRRIGAAAEIQGSGRVPRYRHYGHAWLGVKGAEAAVMIELLLRGQQTMGDLRTRASRIEPIADLATLQAILQQLMQANLVIALTPPGRGQLFTHNLYLPEELEALRSKIATRSDDDSESSADEASPRKVTEAARRAANDAEMESMRTEIADLRSEVAQLRELVAQLEQRYQGQTAAH